MNVIEKLNIEQRPRDIEQQLQGHKESVVSMSETDKAQSLWVKICDDVKQDHDSQSHEYFWNCKLLCKVYKAPSMMCLVQETAAPVAKQSMMSTVLFRL